MSSDCAEHGLPFCELHNIRKQFKRGGQVFECVGIMLDDDDCYYVMSNLSVMVPDFRFLSCVGSIEGHGFDPQ